MPLFTSRASPISLACCIDSAHINKRRVEIINQFKMRFNPQLYTQSLYYFLLPHHMSAINCQYGSGTKSGFIRSQEKDTVCNIYGLP